MLLRVTRPVPRRGGAAPAVVLAAGCGTAVLAWLSLTTAPPLRPGAVLTLTLAVVLAGVVVASRHRGRLRMLALGGALVAALPLLVVAALLGVSDG